ncbi:MAG: hypothetical protein PVG22_11140 [Chromatiales bacterium]
MNMSLVEHSLAQMKRHPIITLVAVLVILLLGLSQIPGGRHWLLRPIHLLTSPAYELRAEIPAEGVMLRWNALVNPWRHPSQELTFQTELKLPLLLRNSGGLGARIVAVRLLSEVEGKEIVWEALWEAEEREWDPGSPIEAQIQQHRALLTPFVVESHEPPQRKVLDFVPLDHPRPLAQGTYHNLLQVKLADQEKWQDLLRFSFFIPANFTLQDSRGHRYQYWQPFAVGPSL